MIGRVLLQRRLILTLAFLLSLLGVFAFLTMPRQEDPTMPRSFGMIVVQYPGADAAKVERLVVRQLEEELAEVEEMKHVAVTIRPGIAVFNVELRDDVRDHEQAWDEVEKKLRAAQLRFPAVALPGLLRRDLVDNQSVVLAITGSEDPLVLDRAADTVEKALLALGNVTRVEHAGVPAEHVRIELHDAAKHRYALGVDAIAQAVARNNSGLAGGSVRSGERVATLRPGADFESLEEIEQLPVALADGTQLPLRELAVVRRVQAAPVAERVRYQGQPAVMLGLVPRAHIDAVAFGKEVRARVAQIAPSLQPLQVQELTFQPDRVDRRLSELSRSLLLGVAIVALVLVFAMGLRLGLLVSSIVPVVAAASVGVFAMSGGVLHQISIAALVLALGMLVDNAIVVSEGIQRRIDEGLPRLQAAAETVRELLLPLGAATGTTLAAFVPMLMAQGPTAEFTRSIPVIVMLTLAISYVFAVTVTPILASFVLRKSEAKDGLAEKLSVRLGDLATARPKTVLAAALLAVVASVLLSSQVQQRFFPGADRNQLVVSLELPEGTHLDATDARARRVERFLSERAEVQSVAAFVGRATPKFYYNLLDRPASPHLAQLLVTTREKSDVESLARSLRSFVKDELPEVEIVARGLEQGPPVRAPVEVRLYGDDLVQLEKAATTVLRELRGLPDTRDVRHDLGVGIPTLRFAADDPGLARLGLGRVDVARALLGATRGSTAGQFRVGDELVPIVVREPDGEELPAEDVSTLNVEAGGHRVPLAQLGTLQAEWQPSIIRRRDRERLVTVEAELDADAPFSRVVTELEARVPPSALPPGVRLEFAGAKEGSGQANSAMLQTLPIGLFLLVFLLLGEFNSFRRVGIVLLTIPLAATGVIPGLVAAGEPFGFMSLLGVFALIGIVVNNAIVLIDVIDSARRSGLRVEDAIRQGVRLRTRPILLTTATTVAGLLPLALSDTSLWPPLAWAMISGLLASTALTLLVTPACYLLLLRREDPGAGSDPAEGGNYAAPAALGAT